MFAAETTAFLEGGCSLIVGTVGADGEPHRGAGMGPDRAVRERGECRLLLDAAATETLADLAATAVIAVTAADVPTLRSIQVKGSVTSDRARHRRRSRSGCAVHRRVLRRHRRAPTAPTARVLERMVPVGYVACSRAIHRALRPDAGAGGRARRSKRVTPMSRRLARATSTCASRARSPRSSRPRRRAGAPNVTYLSRIRVVDDERIALSNQFFSKTGAQPRRESARERARPRSADVRRVPAHGRLRAHRAPRRHLRAAARGRRGRGRGERDARRLQAARRRHLPRRAHRARPTRTPTATAAPRLRCRHGS